MVSSDSFGSKRGNTLRSKSVSQKANKHRAEIPRCPDEVSPPRGGKEIRNTVRNDQSPNLNVEHPRSIRKKQRCTFLF